MNKLYQSAIRLLTTAAVTASLLLVAAASPGAAPAIAAVIPETNPYHNPTQCVYRAWELAAAAGYKLPYFGNAMNWRQGAIDAGYDVIDRVDPSCIYSVIVWGPSVGGVSSLGHVGWVVAVDGNRVLVQDRNWIPATDYEHWVEWVPGISFIRLGGIEAAQPEPTAAATPTASPTRAPALPTARPQPSPTEPAVNLLSRRSTASASDRAQRPAAAAPDQGRPLVARLASPAGTACGASIANLFTTPFICIGSLRVPAPPDRSLLTAKPGSLVAAPVLPTSSVAQSH
ncbi:MAG TPA: CHAP domain-containing protein [Anaerolineae bacterium]|nr:CHAP domain-containing protein [Anaerolineae bacterium]HPL26959.1 CHAP domain-containing protein [Anaerolineae bacterium]